MKRNNYDINDIKRYVNGELNSAERHALELAALNDPFLADALEGYMQANAGKSASDTAFIRDKITAQKNETKIVPLFARYKWLSAAAIVIIIGGAAWLGSTLMSKPKEELAENRSKPAAATSAGTTADSSSSAIKELRKEQTPVRNQIQKQFRENNGRERAVKQEVAERQKPMSATVQQDVAAAETPPVALVAPAPAQKRTFQSQALEGRVAGVPVNANQNIFGFVRDEKNKPVAGASIIIGDRGTATDNNGHFNWPITDSNKLATVFALGMHNKEVVLKPGANTIQLETSNESLSEVVVTGMGTPRKKMNRADIRINIDTVNTYPPTEGWTFFREKLKLFLKDANLYDPSGKAVISFDIIKNGSLRRIRTESTDNKELAEAITEFLESDDFFTYTPDRIRLVIQIR